MQPTVPRILTDQQKAILETKGDIKINAVAGSGKTTTVLEYARTRPKGSRILYLAFNKSVRDEARRRFDTEGLSHVDVETAHSLAFRYIMRGSRLELAPFGYKTHEIASILGLSSSGERHAEFLAANHIGKMAAYFCNGALNRVHEIEPEALWSESKALAFSRQNRDFLVAQTRQLLAKMDRGELPVTHDFYLKKFQLAHPRLPYDYILFDEGQDASAVMLDVFMSQPAVKVIVGDRHQQIYRWRFAVNAMEKVDFATKDLTGSFRFGPDVAALASAVLGWKTHLSETPPVQLTGLGKSEKAGPVKATLGRSNLGLLLRAIDFVSDRKKPRKLYFEGNFNSYTYADDGASLYDVLNLKMGRKSQIKDALLKEMRSVEDLKAYIDKSEDHQLGMMLEVVEEYGDKVPALIKQIRTHHVEDGKKHEADMIFSTVHRAKGMEYDVVHLIDDFVSEQKVQSFVPRITKGEVQEEAVVEEINLLYVAATRTRHTLLIPEDLWPEGLKDSPNIKVLSKAVAPEPKVRISRKDVPKVRSEQVRTIPKPGEAINKRVPSHITSQQPDGAYMPWKKADDLRLEELVEQGMPLREIARLFGRTRNAIAARVKKLGLDGD
jgi:superfamily I DNA/RNA helicase